jgi:hypothetical protein
MSLLPQFWTSALSVTKSPSVARPVDQTGEVTVQTAGLQSCAELSQPYAHENPLQLYPSELHVFRTSPSHCLESGVHILLQVDVELSQPFAHAFVAQLLPDGSQTLTLLPSHCALNGVHRGLHVSDRLSHPFEHVVVPTQSLPCELHCSITFPLHRLVLGEQNGLHPDELSQPYKHEVPSQSYPSDVHV